MKTSILIAVPIPLVFLAALVVLVGCPGPVDTTPPTEAPRLLRPVPGENTGADRRPLFAWSGVADADRYELQADDSPDFDSIDYDWTGLRGTSFTPASDMSVSSTAPVGTRYYLRIRALDDAGNAGPWSGTEPLRCVNVGRFDCDVNGDGFSDAIVGARGCDSFRGRAYIYFGSPSLDDTADLTLNGETADDIFGASVASAGDVNGDGYADVIVGAYGYDSDRGRAYLYFGGPSMDDTADLTLTGEATGIDFGYSVSPAGDVNGDGYADVIVGAFGYGSNRGRVYLFHGGSSMNTIADLTLTGEAAGNSFGASVSSAGDVDGDGYADVIVGANGYDSERGRAYVYCGGSPMDNNPDLVVTGEATSYIFGYSVSSAGDVNADGYADVIIGAPGCNDSQGRVYLYHGGATIDGIVDLTLAGEEVKSSFGSVVASTGDLNGDGYADLIIGAESYANYDYTGRAYLYYGGSTMNDTADLTMTGSAAGDCFGLNVSSAGDVNADGYADVIVGAEGYNGMQGRAYVYCGSAFMDDGIDLTMTGESVGDRFGDSVASMHPGTRPQSQQPTRVGRRPVRSRSTTFTVPPRTTAVVPPVPMSQNRPRRRVVIPARAPHDAILPARAYFSHAAASVIAPTSAGSTSAGAA